MTSKSRETLPPSPIAGRYIVERVLGRGGMATVYLCTDKKTATKVAVKVLREEVGSAVIVERFLREIEFASELDHPRIPKVLDTGVLGALPFYVMTYVEGESLRERLDRVKQLPVDEAVRITSAVIEPMTYAHRVGLVHRDIKPGNILVGDESVYVLDFGIARAIIASAEERLTSTGVAVGTPAYMSPEQALADGALDARSDIYSLACVTYEMIAGIPPFVGATPQAVMARRFASQPPPLSETREGVPPHVEAAVSKALCRAPADRWQTVREFGDALVNADPSPSLQRTQAKLSSRRALYVALVSAVVLMLAVVIGVSSWRRANRDYVGRSERHIISWNFDSAVAELQRGVENRPDDARSQLWLAQMLMLQGAGADTWRPYALRAADNSTRLSVSERSRATALSDYATGNSPNPCGPFQTLAADSSADRQAKLTASLALAECLVGDRRVLADVTSPSGFRFRSSVHRAATLYENLLVSSAERSGAYRFVVPRLEEILRTDKNSLRSGAMVDAADRLFVAWPFLDADTLAYVPVAFGGDASAQQNPRLLQKVVDRNVAKLKTLATAWTRAASEDPAAYETLARMLEGTGKIDGPSPSALEQITIARSLSPGPQLSEGESYLSNIGLASTHVRLLLKVHQFDAARMLAESTLVLPQPRSLVDSIQGIADGLNTGLAAISGRLARVLDINRRHVSDYSLRLETGEVRTLPIEVASDAVKLSIYGAFASPADSITGIATRLSERLATVVPEAQLPETRLAALNQPLAWAAPVIGPGPAARLGPTRDVFGNALRALAAGNLRQARVLSDSLGAMHADFAPGEVTMDAVLRRAWLRASIGDTTGAIRIADNALGGLSRAPPGLLLNYRLPAALVRVMQLRSELAAATGDRSNAVKWARAARALWGRGDPELNAGLTKLVVQ